MFCAPELVFGSTEGVSSRFPILRSRTRFQRCRVRRVPCSCFSLPDSFSAVPRVLILVFIFCALRLIFGGTEGVRYRFHVLRARIRLLRYRGRRVPFSSFALPDSFSEVTRVSVPDFMFCALGLIFCGTDGVRSHFHVLCARTHFLQYRGRLVPFSLPDLFSAVPWASVPVFMFALSDSFSEVPRASDPVFMFCALALIVGGAECVGSRFHVLRARTRFRQYRGRRFSFSCFALPDSFSAVSSASGPVFMFFAPGLVEGVAECVGSRFHVFPP
jgi:hypothetical protein